MMSSVGFSALWAVHMFAVLAFFIGVLLFLVLAIKTFSAKQLKAWALWLVIGGAVLCLFTIAVMGHPWVGSAMHEKRLMMQQQQGGMMNVKGGSMMQQGGMMQGASSSR